jgi:hypothetical protein
MEYSEINFNKIKYIKNNIYYGNEKLIIKSPIMICESGIYENNNKYYIKCKIEDENFIKFLIILEEINKKNSNHKYQTFLKKENDVYYIIFKLCYRYKKFIINVNSDNIILPTVYDIKKNTKLKCNIKLSKIWNFKMDDNNYLSGVQLDILDIMIL